MKKQNKIKKTLRFSFLDGIFAACTNGMVNDYFAPYALTLKAEGRSFGAVEV